MNKIYLTNLKRQFRSIKKDINQAIKAVLESGEYILGETVFEFEDSFAQYCKTNYCVGCNSGTDALVLALQSLNIGIEDEVIVPSNSSISTPEAVSLIGANPVFIDCEPDTGLIDASKIKNAITKKTKAIIAVHLYGQPADLDEIMHIANKTGLYVVEDASHALGATYKERPVGSFGALGCFSFSPTTNLGAVGDAGAIVTNDGSLSNRIRALRSHGSNKRHVYQELGVNSRLDAIQAAILSVKLDYLDSWVEERREIANFYFENLNELKELGLPKIKDNRESAWNYFVVNLKNPEEIKKELEKKHIRAEIHYPIPCHLQPSMSFRNYKEGSLPNTEKWSGSILSLPIFDGMTETEMKRVVKALEGILG